MKARRRKKREKERGRKGKKGRREGREEGKKVASPKFPTPRHNHNYILGYILPVFLLLYIVFCAPFWLNNILCDTCDILENSVLNVSTYMCASPLTLRLLRTWSFIYTSPVSSMELTKCLLSEYKTQWMDGEWVSEVPVR